ncbi:hypothetical protein ACFX13_013205 [Malus domestica]|uniref:F-box domain-containing protein n=2 Tax=Malus domestica TaxID=3750 RepID=A0A498I458_MALDO|nr:hypothetical protein DVH24_002046 [Malus domestica]
MAPEAKSRARGGGGRSGKATDSGAAAAVASAVDLLLEILMRLPARPLHRFKCVSKQWYSLISDPQFRIDYVQKNPNHLLGLLLIIQGPYSEFSFISLGGCGQIVKDPKFLSTPNLKIHHFCNGLMCFSKPHMDSPQFTSYYVCNSASGHSKRIRVLESSTRKRLMAVNVAFDPSKSPFYNVVFVSEESGSELNHLIKIDIYSSETQAWRPSSKGLYIVPYDVDFDNGVYWNGAIYWYHQRKNSLAYFDLDTGCLERLRMPLLSLGSYPMVFDHFGESGGHLHLVGICSPRTTLFTVFELQQDRSGWFVKCNGDLDAVAAAFPKMVTLKPSNPYVFSAVSLIREEKEEELSIVLTIPGSVVRYDVKHKTSRKLCDLPKGCMFNDFMAIQRRVKAHQYIETLDSI